MQSKAATVPEYLASLPEDRRAILDSLRAIILKNIDKGFEERMGYGMMGYAVPHSIFPAGYHCDPKQPLPFAGMASQKQGISLYMMGLYMDPSLKNWFVTAWKATGKKLDMGAACIRFKRLEDVPLDVVAEAFRRMKLKQYVATYEANLAKGGGASRSKKPISKKPVSKKPTAKKASKKATKKTAKKPAKKSTSR